MPTIKLECCEGNPQYESHCLRDRCSIYRAAKHEVQRTWPYVGTGFGNMYGNPSESHYLAQVRANISKVG